MNDESEQITELLTGWRAGDPDARGQLLDRLYPALKQLAEARFRSEAPGNTLQPTALVNEAVIRLLKPGVDINDTAHFMALAATNMRRILVDHAKQKRSVKRGGGQLRVTLTDAYRSTPGADVDMVDLDAALTRLEQLDARKAKVLEMQCFAGLELPEIATLLDISRATVARDLRTAKSWLQVELDERDV